MSERLKIHDATTIASELVFIKDRLGRLGFFKTMIAMDAPLQELGWEIAGRMSDKPRQVERSAERYKRSRNGDRP